MGQHVAKYAETHWKLISKPSPCEARRLLQTAPWPVRVLGPLGNSSWLDFWRDAHLLLHVRDLVRRGLNDTVVIFFDAWDVAFLGCQRSVLGAFRALGRPLFFSAELGFFPFGERGLAWLDRHHGGYPSAWSGGAYGALPPCDARGGSPYLSCRPQLAQGALDGEGVPFAVAESMGGGYRFLNNGCYGGYAWALERALSRLYDEGNWHAYGSDHPLFRPPVFDGMPGKGSLALTQGAWHAYLLAHPGEVALDYGATVCLNLHGLDPARDLRKEADGRVFARPFGKDVCFAHANGGVGDTSGLLDRLLQPGGPRAAPWAACFGPSAAARVLTGKPLTN